MSAGAVVQRADLADAVGFTAKALPRRPVVPVLAGMRVSVGDARVTFSVFDYEVSARAAAEAVTSGSVSVLVNGPEFAASVKALPKGKGTTVLLTADELGVVLECDGVQMTVAGMGAEAEKECPALPPMPEARGIADGAAFARAALRVAECASRDDTLPVLTCVHMEFGAGAVTMAATDRYRLAVGELPWTCLDDEPSSSALVPAYALVMFAKACGKSGKVHVCASPATFADDSARTALPARAGFTDGMRELTVTQNAGEFVKYRSHVRSADADACTVTVDAKALHTAVTAAGKLTGRGEPVKFATAGDRVIITATRDGKAVYAQPVTARVSGDAVEAGYSPAYFASVLSGITGEARIGIVDARKPAMVRAADGFTAVIMPIKLAQS